MAWPDTAVVTALGGGRYALSGIDSVLLDDGGYRIAFNADGITDGAGNAAAGTAALEWTQDTTPPDAVETLRISPDLGASYSDGVTGDASVTLLGTLPDDVATVEILVRSAAGSGTVLVPAFAPEGSELDCAVVLPGSGNLVLVVRCADAEGNVSETEMPVYLDAIPVEAEWDAVQDGRVCELAVLRFSAPVEAADVTVARLSLARDGVDVPLGGVGITALAGGLAFEVAGLDTVCAESGTYELRFDVEGVRKASSGLPMETGTVSARWTYEPVKIAGVEARQRYPWNGLVDIDYVLAGDEPDADSWVEAAVRDTRTGSVMPVWSLSGEGADGPVKAGPHRMVWDMAADRGNEFTADALSVELTARSGDAAYLVVDMGGGAAAESWPVERLPGIPAGGWTDEYKTEKLVMRWIDAGTFTMGSPTDEPGRNLDEVQHEVTLTEGFWMGVFEVTQRQWELATGSNPSCYAGAARPVERVSYGMIRGDGAGAGWPASADVDAGSFLGVLRAKTGLAFDLPTDAQWEYACRAGSLGALNSDKGITAAKGACPAVAEVARYRFNNGLSAESDGRGGYDTAHTAVGSYRPNAWGLFDMHGNVAEWCLDWYDGTASAGAVTNPPGAASGTNRVYRSGHFDSLPRHVRSADRGITSPDRTGVALGLRVAVAGAASTNVVQPLAAPADVAADGTADGIPVSWTASEGATGYEVWRNTADAFASATSLGTTAGTSWPDATAEPGTLYYYWVQAVDSLSASGFSASANAVRELTAPADVTASGTKAAITVRWTASAGATGYTVWRNTKNASGSATNLGTTVATNWPDATAVPGTRYYYWVQAVCPLSTSAFSASAKAVRKLTAPTDVTAAGTTEGITVGWTASTGATGYTVWRNTTNASGSATNLGTTADTNWPEATAEPGTRYYYWVKATCPLSTSGFSASANAVRELTAPTNVTAGGTTAAITVGWTASAGATGYTVWRNTANASGSATNLGTTAGTNWVDTTAVPGTRYYYWVKATCALSTSGFSAAAVAERGLAAPVVTVRDASTTNGWALAVSWTRVDGAASYEVWRGSGGTFDTATWMTTTNGTNWVDSGASAKTTNTYWVVAKNGTLEGRSEGAQGRPWFSLMSLRSLLTGIDAIRTPDRILSEHYHPIGISG